MKPSEAGLTPFQLTVAELFFTLPDSDGFLIAGGAAAGQPSQPSTSRPGRPRTWTCSPAPDAALFPPLATRSRTLPGTSAGWTPRDASDRAREIDRREVAVGQRGEKQRLDPGARLPVQQVAHFRNDGARNQQPSVGKVQAGEQLYARVMLVVATESRGHDRPVA